MGLHDVTRGYKWLERVTGGLQGLQGVTRGHRGLVQVTGS